MEGHLEPEGRKAGADSDSPETSSLIKRARYGPPGHGLPPGRVGSAKVAEIETPTHPGMTVADDPTTGMTPEEQRGRGNRPRLMSRPVPSPARKRDTMCDWTVAEYLMVAASGAVFAGSAWIAVLCIAEDMGWR